MFVRLIVAAVIVAAAGCSGTTPAAAPAASPTQSPEADAREVEAVLRRWYDASEKHDSAGWTDVLTPAFVIVEDTTVYDKPTLTTLLVQGFGFGVDRAKLSDFRTSVNGDVAWSTFRNDEIWTPTGGPSEQPRRFVETAVFRRIDGRWLIDRYHATRINR